MNDKKIRSFRVSDSIWNAARLRAVAEGITVTSVLERALADFVRGTPAAQAKALSSEESV